SSRPGGAGVCSPCLLPSRSAIGFVLLPSTAACDSVLATQARSRQWSRLARRRERRSTRSAWTLEKRRWTRRSTKKNWNPSKHRSLIGFGQRQNGRLEFYSVHTCKKR